MALLDVRRLAAAARPGALEAELKNVDTARELRRAGVKQLWIAVPFVVAIVAVTQGRAAS